MSSQAVSMEHTNHTHLLHQLVFRERTVSAHLVLQPAGFVHHHHVPAWSMQPTVATREAQPSTPGDSMQPTVNEGEHLSRT